MTALPRNAAFFDRKRRLAYLFAWASMGFLMLQLSLGFFLEVTARPRAAPAADGFRVIHRAANQDDADHSRLLALDPEGRPSAPPLTFPDVATAVLPEGADTTVFFGSHAARIAGGQVNRSVALDQKWDVQASVADPSGDWVFGWNENRVVARRRVRDGWSPEIGVASSPPVEQIVASREGSVGPLVAWRERDATRVKVALFDGAGFDPKPDVEIGPVDHWDLLLAGGRRVVVVYNRDDRTYQYVTLRLDCCPDCPSPIGPRKVQFAEPLLLLGRKVTGLSAAASGDRLRIFVTRISTLMTASLPLPSLQTDAAATRLQSISSQPLWRYVVAGLAPGLLMFCSFSMIFLGFVLFRERARPSGGIPVPGPPLADFLTRAMAVLLDFALLGPAMLLILELIAPEADLFDVEDPNLRKALLTCLGLIFAYYFLLEGALGWTVGKKILGLRVVHVDGSRLTWRGALLRALLRIVEALPNPFAVTGTASILLTQRRQRLGDLAARTLVIQDLPE
jgi:uncharacterized RDD family membrane protein YckC